MQRFWELIENIQKDKFFASITASLFAVVMIYLNMAYMHSSIIGWIVFVLFFFINASWLTILLARFFQWSRGWSFIFSWFILLNVSSLLLAIPIDLFRYSTSFVALSLLLITLSLRIFIKMPVFAKHEVLLEDTELKKVPKTAYEPNKYLLLIFPALFLLGFLFLLQGRTGDFILSPWEVIPRLYLYIYLVVTAVVALLIFSKRKTRVLLIIIILQSFLLHAYLPFVYETGFGGDKWRHLASENFIKTGEVYQPALIGDVEYTKIGPVTIPSVFVSGNKTSYGQQWALTILISETLQIDPFWVDYWLIFFIWSLFLPLLLYQLAGLIRPGRNFRLLFAFLPVLFYPLQVFGAITLPVSIGHLLFVFALYGWLYFYKYGGKGILIFNILLSFLMYFGYVLHVILIWEVALLVLTFKYLKPGIIPRLPRRLIKGVVVAFLVLFIPFLEYLQGYGGLKEGALHFTKAFSNLSDAFGHFSGLVAFLPQPSHVDQGNFLFNQTRADHAPVSFLSFRLWPLLFTLLAWVAIILGIRAIKYLKKVQISRFFIWLFVIVLSNYIISWYFMDGNHILARRLDQTIVLYMSVFIALGAMFFIEKINYLPWGTKILLIAIVVAFISTSTYASGPHLQVVTKDEHLAAQYVWEKIDKSDEYYCVVANTWPLLAVEAESSRAIVGGGFPVGFEYSQPERVKIFEKMSQHPDLDLLYWAKDVTHDDVCYYMNEDRWINDRVYKETINLLGEPEKTFDDIYIWRF